MKKNKKKILVVEDESICAEYLKIILKEAGYIVVATVDKGRDAIIKAILLKPDLILMDIMLKDSISGCEAAVEIHKQNRDIKIIFLTAYAEKEMIDYAVESDAIAYLMKPYIEAEILATVKLVFAHNEHDLNNEEEDTIKLCHGYIFHTKKNRLFNKDNQEIHLGIKALRLIEILVKNINISVSKEQICTYVWGEPKNDRTLRSLIYRIRHMIEYNIIENINGVGYKIRASMEMLDSER